MKVLPIACAIAAFVLGLGRPTTLHADLVRCGNLWTNKHCSEEPRHVMEEIPYHEPSESEQLAAKKKFMYDDLDVRRVKAQRRFGVSVHMIEAEEICLAAHTSLADCSNAVRIVDEQIDKRISAANRGTAAHIPSDGVTPPQQNLIVINDTYPDDWYWHRDFPLHGRDSRRHKRDKNPPPKDPAARQLPHTHGPSVNLPGATRGLSSEAERAQIRPGVSGRSAGR